MEYRFCPRCGGGLDRRVVKANEPKRLVCQACSFIFYQDPKVVAGTVFTLDGGIVLLKRGVEPALGKWVFPGGYVDRGESVQDAAVRETKEESQLDVKLGPLLNVYSYPRSPNVIVVYTADVIGGRSGTAGCRSPQAVIGLYASDGKLYDVKVADADPWFQKVMPAGQTAEFARRAIDGRDGVFSDIKVWGDCQL